MPSWFMLFLRRYSGLTIKYVRGADPVIKLLDDDESVIEVRNIFFFLDSWIRFGERFQTMVNWHLDSRDGTILTITSEITTSLHNLKVRTQYFYCKTSLTFINAKNLIRQNDEENLKIFHHYNEFELPRNEVTDSKASKGSIMTVQHEM